MEFGLQNMFYKGFYSYGFYNNYLYFIFGCLLNIVLCINFVLGNKLDSEESE